MPLTPEQAAVLKQIRGEDALMSHETPSEAMRTFAQGATFNTADELEAAIQSAITGRPQQEIAQEIRQKIEDYKAQSPTEAKLVEFAGSAVPSALIAAATRNPAPLANIFTKIAPNLAKVARIGTAEGVAQTFGSMEQPVSQRFESPTPYLIGGVVSGLTGAALHTAGLVGLKGVDVASNVLRYLSGSRARNAVNNEVQRIVQEAGITPEEAINKLINGELLAEDPNVALALRPLIGGGAASAEIRGTMGNPPTNTGIDLSRPGVTRREARQTITSGIAAGLDRNIYRMMRAKEDLLRKMERTQYDNAFKSVQDAPQEVIDEMGNVIASHPEAGNKLKRLFTAETGLKDLYSVGDKGEIVWKMLPTMKDAELLRRAMYDESQNMIRSGGIDASLGINVGNAEKALRNAIDNASPEIMAARQQARFVRTMNENYNAGKKASQKPADEVEAEFGDILRTRDPQLIQAYRLGYLENLKSKFESGNKASNVARMVDPESTEGRTFRIIYPRDMQDAALNKLGIAKQSQAAASTLLGGSATAPTLTAATRMGMLPEAVRSAQLAADVGRGDISAAISLIGRIAKQFNNDLTDAQKLAVTKVLLSKDQQLVRNALTDKEYLKVLTDKIGVLAGMPAMTTALAGQSVLSPEIEKNLKGEQ